MTVGVAVTSRWRDAFMELPNSHIGFVHRFGSFSDRAMSVDSHQRVGGEVAFRMFGTDERGRTELSAERVRPKQAEPGVRGGERSENSFEEKLRRFLKESRERQDELTRNAEAKRGRGRRR